MQIQHKLRLFALIFFTYTLTIYSSYSSTSLNGYIKDTESKETIIGAVLSISGTNLGAYSNKNGFYSITNIPSGKQEIRINFIGYKEKVLQIDFKNGQSLRRDIELEQSPIMTDEVTVRSERADDRRQISISRINVPVKQLKKLRIGGESDVFRSLQFLPGILTSSQISSGLFVRGGSPDQNLVLIDGATVYNPSHLFGFISTFNADAIKDVDLIKGGFPAEYGGRLSAVLAMTQKDGNKEEFHGKANLGVLSSKLSLEGPGLPGGSWFIGGRRTYFELIKEFLPDDPTEPIPDFNFYDINAKYAQDIGIDDKLFFSGFMSKDNLDYDGIGATLNLDVGNTTGSLRWTRIIKENLFNSLSISGSQYTNRFSGGPSGFAFLIENQITDYTLKETLEWYNSDYLTHKFGFEVTNYVFDYIQSFTGEDTVSSSGSNDPGSTNLQIVDWNYSAFAQANYNIMEIVQLQGGLRASYWDLSKHLTIDPRVAMKYKVSDDFSVKAAWGIYHQNLRLAAQPDFSFFDTWLPTDTTLPPSKSIHYILSAETVPYEGYNLNFDLYYKQMYDVSELNRNILSAEEANDIFLIGDAESYGFEIFLQKKYGKLTGWVGYALGFISSKFDSINNGEEFRPKYDRRHDLKIVVQYEIDKNWDIGGSFTFQSGQSFTGATSVFSSRLPGRNNGKLILVPSQRYGLRLPNSHQLNLNGSYAFKIYDYPSRLILDIYNVYSRRDIWFRYYNTREDEIEIEDVRLLPIIPTISFEITF